jgi:DNA polymerase III subunit delta'
MLMSEWPIVGHEWAVRQLKHAVEGGELPHALLFTGPESVGKSTLAEWLVAAMLCRDAEEKPCGRCLSCRKLRSGNHPDFVLVEPEDRTAHIKIDQIRDVERFLALTPVESAHKLVLIRGFEQATVGAANALLKTLEEPPAYAHLLLLAANADLLLATIVSRTQQVALRPVPASDIVEALTQRWSVDTEQAQRLASLSGGRIGWAVTAATNPAEYERAQTALQMLLKVLQEDLPARFESATELARDGAALNEALEYWSIFWRDLLLIRTGHPDLLVYREQQPTLKLLARSVSTEDCLRILKQLEQTQDALLSNANTQLVVENLLLDLPALQSVP